MNILIISPGIYPCITGGVEIFNYYLIKQLAKGGHKIWVLTTCGYDWNKRNISIEKLNKRFLLHPTLSTEFHLSLQLIKLKKQIDVIHVPYTSNSPLAYPILFVKKFFDIHYVISIHGGGMYPWKPKTLHKLFFKYADAIVAASETIKEEYEERSGRKIKMIPPLIPFRESKIPKNELRNEYGLSDNDTVVLSLGSIKKIKGSDILLDAFLKLGREYIKKNSLKLIYVGDGLMKPQLQEQVDKINYNQYVKFLGSVSYEDVPEMYKLADIYVIPSLFEGTPKSLLEAMFNALPVIGSNTNGINDKIIDGENGLLFELGDCNGLKKKIKLLIENPDLRKIGLKAKETIKTHYIFKNTIKEFTRVYQSIEGNR